MIRYNKIIEEAQADSFDLVSLYNEFNQKYFNSRLPKGIAGTTENVDKLQQEAMRGVFRDYVYIGTTKASNSTIAYAKWGGFGNRMRCISIQFKMGWEYDEDPELIKKNLHGIMIHEMCHFACYHEHREDARSYDPSKQGHGPEFVKFANELTKLTGIQIDERYHTDMTGVEYISPKDRLAKINHSKTSSVDLEKLEIIINHPKKSQQPMYVLQNFHRNTNGEPVEYSFRVFENFKPFEKHFDSSMVGVRPARTSKTVEVLDDFGKHTGAYTWEYTNIPGYIQMGSTEVAKVFKITPQELYEWAKNKKGFLFNKKTNYKDKIDFMNKNNKEFSDYFASNGKDITQYIIDNYSK